MRQNFYKVNFLLSELVGPSIFSIFTSVIFCTCLSAQMQRGQQERGKNPEFGDLGFNKEKDAKSGAHCSLCQSCHILTFEGDKECSREIFL